MEKYLIAQNVARQTMSELHDFIKPGMNEEDIAQKALDLMEKKGSTSWWYHGVGAFVLLGKRSIESISGTVYEASPENVVSENDIVTIDLTPTVDGFLGDYARTVFVEDGVVAEEDNPEAPLFRKGLEAEIYLHNKLFEYATPEITYEELFIKLNNEIDEIGFENLDLHGNLGHSIEFDLANRVYLERGNTKTFDEVGKPFTLEPHIREIGGRFGFKREDIYYFDKNGELQLL